MTPFQQLRLWARRAPAATRLSALLALAICMALLAWAVSPIAHQQADRTANVVTGGTPGASVAGGPAAGAAGQPAANTGTPSLGASGGSSAAGSVTGTTPTATGAGSVGGGCHAPAGTDQGASPKEIKVAVGILNISGAAANSTFGLPSPTEVRQDYELVISDLNARGGAGCHQIVPMFYEVNGTSPSDQQDKCLQVAQAKVFAVLDSGGFAQPPAAKACIMNQAKVPYFGSADLSQLEVDKFYPLVFNLGGIKDMRYRNTVFALRDRGFFTASNGFKKLGIVYRDCNPDVIQKVMGWHAAIGVSSPVTYNFGCPAAFASPSDIQQAILKFQQAGVTHVSAYDFVVDFANFTRIAQQQGFRPKWGLPNDGEVATSTGVLAPNFDNIENAIAISDNRYGEERTSIPQTAGTKRCEAIFTSKGRPKLAAQADAFGGIVCSQVWQFAAAVDHAPALQRTALSSGMQAARSVDFSYPMGPNDFSGARVTYGGEFWRPLQYQRQCACWNILDATFKPSYS
jgi:hypothetical protein